MISKKMRKDIDEYKKEHNGVILFVEEECVLDAECEVSKRSLYDDYTEWCKACGHFPLKMIKFGKELKRQYKNIVSERTAADRLWLGIDTEANHQINGKKTKAKFKD